MGKNIIIYINELSDEQIVLLGKFLYTIGESKRVVEEKYDIVPFSVGNLQIDPQQHEVRFNGRLVKLTPMEFNILLLLAHRPGQIFSAQQIYENVAADTADGSWSGIPTMVYKLRCKLGPDIIQTIRGCGYRLSIYHK